MTNIMDLTVENLAKEQFQYLKEHSVNVLNKVIECIQKDDFKSIEEMMAYSADGDMGDENYYINFAWNKGDNIDICDLINKLEGLKEVIDNVNKRR